MHDLTSRQIQDTSRTKPDSESETLKEELTNILEECRMVLPGMQALFGFQTIAVFNQRFQELSAIGAAAHLLSLVLVAMAIALNMAPAAYHRIAEPGRVSRRMISRSSACICAAMLTLMVGFALEMFVVFDLATGQQTLSLAVALLLLLVIGIAWFAFPLFVRRQRARRRP
jgi:hypothetical protein